MKKIYIGLMLALFPLVASAQLLERTRVIFESGRLIIDQVLIPLVFALALLVFFWGVVKYIKSEGEGKEDGKRIMVWGIVALFVISSVWGLVFFLRRELGVDNNPDILVPSIRVN